MEKQKLITDTNNSNRIAKAKVDTLKTNNDNIKANAFTINDRRKYEDRGIAAPSIPKAGFTKRRRRLEDGGKATE
jgi:hypothetical protein